MKPVRLYLDEAAERGLVKNDTDLGARLGVGRSAVCEWRKGRSAPNEDQAAALAALLGKPEVMPECAAARAKTPQARAAWERLAKMASMSAALSAVVIANYFFSPERAEAAPPLVLAPMTIGIMLSLLFLTGRRRSDAHACARHEFGRPAASMPA